MNIPMVISDWWPRTEPLWQNNGDGSWKCRIVFRPGVVDLFTFVGNERYRAFTKCETFIGGVQFSATLPRTYHPRWFRRVAQDFLYQAWEQARAKNYVGKDACGW